MHDGIEGDHPSVVGPKSKIANASICYISNKMSCHPYNLLITLAHPAASIKTHCIKFQIKNCITWNPTNEMHARQFKNAISNSNAQTVYEIVKLDLKSWGKTYLSTKAKTKC